MTSRVGSLIVSISKSSIKLILSRSFCHSKLCEQERKCDVAVIGGGIIGTSIARKLKMEHNNLQVFLLEKECSLAKHQSSHNSGVIHCGVYYKPGSLKAKFCVQGNELLQKYCDEKNITYKKCGKMIVAKNCAEVSILDELLERGLKNKVKGLKLLESNCDIMQISSGCRGVKALWCPQTANVDFKKIVQSFASDLLDMGGKILLNTKVINILETDDCTYPLCIRTECGSPVYTKYAITCGGLQSDALSKILSNSFSNQTFISLKVDYHKIDSKHCNNIETNIYPVPDLDLPFLGAHFSPQMDDTVLLGPHAMPALKPEGYCNDEVNIRYLSNVLKSCGFRNMIARNFSKCVKEASKAICSEAQIKDLQDLVPNFSYQHVEKGPTAVQCQLLNNDGTFVDDFVFEFFKGNGLNKRVINIKYTPSPAASSCIAIAYHVVDAFSESLCQDGKI